MKILDWHVMKQGAGELINKKLIIYGTSSSGNRILDYLEFLELRKNVICASDSDEHKWGSYWNGLKIVSPKEMCKISIDNIIVIVASAYIKEIYKYLLEINCPYDIVGSKAYMHAFHYDLINKNIKYFSNKIIENYKNIYEIWINIDVKYDNLIKKTRSYDFIRTLLIRKECILVHSMQKTGNMTLEASLNKYSNAVMSIHSLCDDNEEKRTLSKIIKNQDKKIKILSGVRYPIERIISQKWQNYQMIWMYNDKCLSTIIDERQNKSSGLKISTNVTQWFKDQIESLFGIDVFQYPFNINKGYTIINKDNISLFLYRLDYLSKLEKEIGGFIGYDDFELINYNKAEDKSYALAYQEYLKEVQIDSVFFEKLMSSKEMLHFFSESEREDYYKKWKPYLK